MKKFVIPKTLGAAVDLLAVTTDERLELEAKVRELKERETLLENHIIQELPRSKAEGVAGKLMRVTIVDKEYPTVKDWDAFYKFIEKRHWWHLLQKRTSNKAIEELWDEGETVPGVEKFKVKKLSRSRA